MNRGYIKLWRVFQDGGYIQNHKLCAFMIWCLLKANHKQNFKAIIGKQRVILKPGQFVFGRRKASEETGLSEREIRTIIDFLKKLGFLTIKSTNKFSIITIINWHIYQANKDENDQQNDQQLTSKRPHTRIQEYKKNNADSRISALIAFFHEQVTSLKGYEPQIDGGDAKAVQRALKKFSECEVKDIIAFFLNGNQKEQGKVTLKAMLSTHSLTLWQEQRKKSNWQVIQ